MAALVDVVVGPADADPARTNQRMVGAGPRSGPFLDLQFAGSSANQSIHRLHVNTCALLLEQRERKRPGADVVPAPGLPLLELVDVFLSDERRARVDQQIDLLATDCLDEGIDAQL